MKTRRKPLRTWLLIELIAWALIIAFIVVMGFFNSSASAATATAATAATAATTLPRESHVPGGVITFTIAAAEDDRPKVTLDGVAAMVVREGDHWRTIVGIPLST